MNQRRETRWQSDHQNILRLNAKARNEITIPAKYVAVPIEFMDIIY